MNLGTLVNLLISGHALSGDYSHNAREACGRSRLLPCCRRIDDFQIVNGPAGLQLLEQTPPQIPQVFKRGQMPGRQLIACYC